MAADLTGMFAQMNKAIQGNPMAGQLGKDLVAQFSQGVGQAASGATGMLTPDMQKDPYGFMTQPAKEQYGREALGKLDLQTAAGMGQAAQIYQKIGDPEKAVVMANKAKEMTEQEAKAVTQNRQERTMLDIVDADSSMTAQERAYYQAAIVNGTIKTREDYINAKKGVATGDLSILKGGTIRDEKGNIFNTTTVSDKDTGLSRTEYSVVGQGPAEPVGKITPISPTTGLNGTDTANNRMELARYNSYLNMSEAELDAELKKGNIDYQTAANIRQAQVQSGIDLEEKWQTERADIIMNLPNVELAKQSAEKALDLLDTTSTSGVATSINKIADMFGIGDTSDYASLNAAMSTYVLENLRKMGANPTEGERAFLIDAAANISRGTEANVALFEKTLKRLNMNAEASRFLLENPAATRDEYVAKYNTIIEAQNSTRRIKLGDMN